MSRSALRLVAGIFVFLVVVAGAGGAFFWWKVQGLKEQLVHNLELALGAKVEVSSINLDLWKGELQAAGITLTNERPNAPWEKGKISQAAVKFHLHDLFARTLPLNIEVSSWSVDLHPFAANPAGTSSTSAPPESAAPTASSSPESSKNAIQVTQLSAQQGTVEIHLSGDKQVSLQGVAFEATDNGTGIWTTALRAASIVADTLETTSNQVQIRGEKDKITFSNLSMQCGQGAITGDGEIALIDLHPAHATLKAVEVPLVMLVGVQWKMELSGLVNGDLRYEGNDQAGDAKGRLVVGHPKFNVLPWLGKVTALVGLQDISDVELDKATSDYEWKNGTFHFTNLDVRKNDVTRIAGAVDVNAQGQVDGKLKLGLPSTITAKWPQLQDKIFSVPFEDYNWTEVHLTGTPDHLQEDLTPRLVAFGTSQGTDLINSTSQKAMDLFKSFMGN